MDKELNYHKFHLSMNCSMLFVKDQKDIIKEGVITDHGVHGVEKEDMDAHIRTDLKKNNKRCKKWSNKNLKKNVNLKKRQKYKKKSLLK